MLDYILSFLPTCTYGGSNTLNTGEIDWNVEALRKYTWFENI
ncbi:hypothetical protein [Metabacillus fastidiosus]